MARHAIGLSLLALLASGTAIAQPLPVGPPAPATASELEALRAELSRDRAEAKQQLEAQARALAELRARLAAQDDARRAEEARIASAVAEVKERAGLGVRAGRFGLTLSGLVQADGVFWRQSSVDELDPSTGEPLNESRFLLRRARLRAELDYRFLFGSFEIDANTVRGPQVRPIAFDVGVRYKNPADAALPYVALHMGLVRTPFGFEVQQRDKDRLFLERATVFGAFFPGEYDLGARIYGGWRFLRYALGAMNGDPIGEKLFPGRDPAQSKDLVFRVGVELALARVGLRAGASTAYGQGFHKGVAAGKDSLVWRDQNQNGQIDPGELISIPGQAYQPSKTFARYALGGDLGLSIRLPRVGALTLLGELVYGVNMDRGLTIADPISTARDLRELGWYVGATQELTPWAMIGLRYDRYDPDRDSTDLTGGRTVPRDRTFGNLVVTAAGRLPGYGRVILEYAHATNALGRREDGTPTTLADDSLTLRAEVTF